MQSRADPESGSNGSDSLKSANSSLGAIYLGPRIIALDSLRLSSPSIRQNLAQWCDGAFGPAYTSRIRAMEIRDHPTGPRSPWQNGHVERLIGSIRRESLDHIIVFGEAHLVAVLKDYTSYYNEVRAYVSLEKDAPDFRRTQKIGRIAVVARSSVLGYSARPPVPLGLARRVLGGIGAPKLWPRP